MPDHQGFTTFIEKDRLTNALEGRKSRNGDGVESQERRRRRRPFDSQPPERHSDGETGEGEDSRYSLERWMRYIFVPLTPALSLGERENYPSSFGHTLDRAGQASVR